MTKPRALANSVNVPVLQVEGGTAFSVASATNTKATFGAERVDNINCFASNRYTPNVAGYYQVNAAVQYDGANNANCYATIQLQKNGVVFAEGSLMPLIQFCSPILSEVVYLNGTTDYIEIWMNHNETTSRNMRGKSLSAFWICP